MSLVEWNNRVVEAEAELRCAMEERADVDRKAEAKQAAIHRHKDVVKKDKAALTRKLQELEKDALDLANRTESATTARDEAEGNYHGAMNAYEALHDLVKAIKAEEAAIAARPDLDKQLELESVQWAEEEHRLRAVLQGKEQHLKEVRKAAKDHLGAMEARVKLLEATLAKDREQRRAEGWIGGGDEGPAAMASTATHNASSKAQSRKRQGSPLRDRTNTSHQQ